ncbi:MAG: chromosome segregation protein SMC [Planctomycetota bacterium]
MRLTRVEMAGFKSFAERTSFDISQGITCFVGPNGCGKSNLVDALKWALGEQRPTSLRGDAMVDVIFKGNQSRTAAPHAEVALTFSNEDGKLAIDSAEISVTRKLHRSGESEYFLNGELCRLKDIKTLLMDTGVGLTAYSFMEQGRIDALLSSSAIERRSVFEEAAGISKYRLRRQETLRKLERVEQDLLRAGDLIAELERQSRSLKQQAGRARSYQAYHERLQVLLAAHLHHEYQALLAERLVLVRECDARGAVESALRARVAELEERTRAAEQHESRLTEDVSTKRSSMADRKARGEAAERRVADLEIRQREFELALAEAADRLQILRQAVLAKEAERATLAESLAQQRTQEKEITVQLLAVHAREEAIDGQLREVRAHIEPMARERARLQDEHTSLKRQAFELGSSLETFAKQRRKGMAKQQEVAALIAERARELSALHVAGRGHERHLAELNQQLAMRRRSLDAALERGAALRQRLDRLAAELHALESRREVLAHAIKEFEGVDEGVRALLQARDVPAAEPEAGASVPQVRGLLADLLSVDVQHSRAVESALGPYAQAVLVDRLDDVKRAFDFLKQRGVGKVTFLPLLDILSLEAPHRTMPLEGGERLIDHLRFDPVLWPLFEWLVGDVALVERDELFVDAARNGHWRRVTLDGDLRTPHGAVEGGGRKNGAGLIARRSELADLDVRLVAGREQHAQLTQQMAEQDAGIALYKSEIDLIASRASQVGAELHEIERKSRAASERAALQRGELRVGLSELIVLERDRADVAAHLTRNQRDESRVALAIETAGSELARLERESARLAESRPALREERARLELDLARLRERLTALAKQLQSLDASLEEGRAELQRIEKQAQELELKQSAAAEEVDMLQQDLLTLQVERARLAEELAAAQAEQEQVRRDLQSAREEARAEREHFARVVEEGRDVQLREQRNGLLLANLKDKANSELGVEIDAITADAAQTFDDWAAVEAEVQDLKLKMQRLGAVNLEAIEELTQVEQRFEFMTKERDDLVQAQKSLRQMIAEMDEESRTRFQKTFEEVRQNFQAIFRQLFHGGHADLLLEAGVDILEAGVDVVAAPPGKKPQTITLLSGGERTLTAVGLLFALFKMRPSPICVLDEVDAALDESNIERLCAMIGDYETSTQFLIVTHSKRTMARAEVLYGITMEGDGISRPIAIRLNEYQEKVA